MTAFLALSYVAFVAGKVGRLGWQLAFVDGRIFPAWYGLDWSIAISGCFDFLLYLAMGIVLASLVVGSRRIWWTFVFGMVGAAIPLYYGRWHFEEGAEWYVYLNVYSHYIFPPLGALAGGIVQVLLASRMIRKDGPNVEGRPARSD